MKKTVGIIGGMGPLATCDLLETIIKFTEAEKDQEHIHVLVDCNTNIPDRTKAILHGGEDPVPELIKSGKRLIEAGAELLVMHCNTVHYFHDRVAKELSVPLLHIPEETARALAAAGVRKAGILATNGTRQAGVYDKALSKENLSAVWPQEEAQDLLMSVIYDYIKAGKTGWDKEGISAMIREMKERGAERIVIGCTEIPLILRELDEYKGVEEFTEDLGFIDPAVLIAKIIIQKAGYKVKTKGWL